ncbi:MAG: MFS transporter [Actinomycetota bacterium]|nr:MFS transporter [Actinomycetota bacterium]
MWQHRDFLRLWGGESISDLGSQISMLALPILAVRTLHASTFSVGLLSAAGTLAFLLIGLPAGALVDRMARRGLMIAADLGRAAALASIPLAAGLGALTMTQLYLVALTLGVLTVFFDVAYQSYVPGLVAPGEVVAANAKLSSSSQVAQVAGPGAAGGLIQAIGAPLAMAFDAASFGLSALALRSIRTREVAPPPKPARRRLREEIAEGVGFVARHEILRALTATTATANFFSAVITAVEVVFLVRALHTPPGIVGLLFAGIGVGGLVGALAAARIATRLGGARAVLVGAGATVAGLAIPLSGPGLGLMAFGLGYGVSAVGIVVYNITQVSYRQRLCPPELLGRMNATIRFVAWGALPLGALAGGTLGTAIGLRPTLWIGALGQASAVGWLLASPLRSQRDFPAAVGA